MKIYLDNQIDPFHFYCSKCYILGYFDIYNDPRFSVEILKLICKFNLVYYFDHMLLLIFNVKDHSVSCSNLVDLESLNFMLHI